MTDRPIPFRGPMVLAILAGTKTQTRRLIRPRKHASLIAGGWTDAYVLDPGNAEWLAQEVPYAVGDRLWVREAWRAPECWDDTKPSRLPVAIPIRYEADGPACCTVWGRLRPGMFMLRWASRLTLTVTDVRVQRLQEISRADAIAEGLRLASNEIEEFFRWPEPLHEQLWLSPVAAYRSLWDSLNAKRAPWASNPWVVAITFTARQGNIDHA